MPSCRRWWFESNRGVRSPTSLLTFEKRVRRLFYWAPPRHPVSKCSPGRRAGCRGGAARTVEVLEDRKPDGDVTARLWPTSRRACKRGATHVGRAIAGSGSLDVGPNPPQPSHRSGLVLRRHGKGAHPRANSAPSCNLASRHGGDDLRNWKRDARFAKGRSLAVPVMMSRQRVVPAGRSQAGAFRRDRSRHYRGAASVCPRGPA